MSRPQFAAEEAFAPAQGYQLLPLRFARLNDAQYIATNDAGEYVLLTRGELVSLINHELSPDSSAYRALKVRHFLFDGRARSPIDLMALKVRTRAERLAWFTGLHIFVVTLRCDHSCGYCQVSRQTEDKANFDMALVHADRAVEFMFRSPSPNLKVEFQGGEPLLNFALIRHVVSRALELNQRHQRRLAFVIASNLSRLTDEILAFCREHKVSLSTSLDGPAALHDAQRPVRGGNSHQRTIAGIQRARETLGFDAVSALMTTTAASLSRVEEIIDEYVHRGFRSIFLRSMSPYGFAVRKGALRVLGDYQPDEWLSFYKRGLDHIIKVNQGGYRLIEEYTAILLQKITSPQSGSYVDLQSPTGSGIGALVYNYDGAIYASDEGRMLAEAGDTSLRLGHLMTDRYEDVLGSESFVAMLLSSMTEGAPQCSDCAFLPYCGADPAFHRATQGDFVGHKAFSAFCQKQMGTLRHLITLLEQDAVARQVLLGWTEECC